MLGGAAVLIAVQPAVAAPVQVTAVRVNPTANGVDVVLQTRNGDRPQVFAVNRGNSWTADVTNSQLKLPGGSSFRQANPTGGISLVTVAPLDSSSIRITVTGQATAPVGQVVRPAQGGLILSLSRAGSAQALAPAPAVPASLPGSPRSVSVPAPQAATPPRSVAVPPPQAAAAPRSVLATPPQATPAPSRSVAVPPIAQAPAPQTPSSPAPSPASPNAPLVPNPEITIQGPAPAPVGPTRPRAIAPPVGDISAAQTDASAGSINLGTGERIPRLVLRDAPAREVLSLLARAAGLNIAYVDPPTTGQQQQQQQQGAAEGPKVTLDIENESVQDVFNYVIRLANLEANRVGRTIFVGPRLPNAARNFVVRSVRLNQVPITNALNFLVSLGAESAVSRERQVVQLTAIPVGQLAGGAQNSVTQSQTTTESRVETQRVDYRDSTPLLRGLQVSGDERTNQITLVGNPRLVEVATAQLTQLDVRRRQVTVNVRVVDVNLAAAERFGTSFSFGVDSNQFLSEGGVAVLNFGRRSPASAGLAPENVPLFPAAITSFGATNFVRSFLAQLQASVTNGNAKILTDPTLLVQEGQTATVNLTQEVVTNLRQQVTATENSTQITVEVEKGRAGLILPIRVDRIDDNGFVSLSIAPSITRPDNAVSVQFPGTGGGGPTSNVVTLLSERRLESGQVRLRDGQTLLLSGIIEDQDRVTVSKVPILGDIPLLGALFRRTVKEQGRREVIVLVTPRVLDDSDASTFGYSPSPAVQQVLDRANPPAQAPNP
ncbi:AMIN domain-containing protein [Leptolyngbya sp. FACHB-36]|nr:AMIN domain-containing protein [Leptolyngbya sp. FACHB-36]MBD2018823.1 AMIN domain-containing protein [Leptolyngbya sp. FACHB-36]